MGLRVLDQGPGNRCEGKAGEGNMSSVWVNWNCYWQTLHLFGNSGRDVRFWAGNGL